MFLCICMHADVPMHMAAMQVQFDYSSLQHEHKAAADSKQRDKLSTQFQADIEERSALLSKLAPNLKAVEQYEAVKVREPVLACVCT